MYKPGWGMTLLGGCVWSDSIQISAGSWLGRHSMRNNHGAHKARASGNVHSMILWTKEQLLALWLICNCTFFASYLLDLSLVEIHLRSNLSMQLQTLCSLLCPSWHGSQTSTHTGEKWIILISGPNPTGSTWKLLASSATVHTSVSERGDIPCTGQ